MLKNVRTTKHKIALDKSKQQQLTDARARLQHQIAAVKARELQAMKGRERQILHITKQQAQLKNNIKTVKGVTKKELAAIVKKEKDMIHSINTRLTSLKD